MPVFTYRPTDTHIVVSPQYYRMGFFGGDISKPLGQLVLRGEAAFNVGKHFSYRPDASDQEQKGFNTVNYLVGIDWYAPKDWVVMAQFSSESIPVSYTHLLDSLDEALLCAVPCPFLLRNSWCKGREDYLG